MSSVVKRESLSERYSWVPIGFLQFKISQRGAEINLAQGKKAPRTERIEERLNEILPPMHAAGTWNCPFKTTGVEKK